VACRGEETRLETEWASVASGDNEMIVSLQN
jgi:hypothetical protein